MITKMVFALDDDYFSIAGTFCLMILIRFLIG